LRRQLEEEVVERQSPASKDVSTEAEVATGLQGVTRRQSVKIREIETTTYML
jgi:hypothetical protein